MSKRVLCIHDISSIGRCSLSVVVPILASYGIEPVPLPTSVYSMHTGYKGYICTDLTQHMIDSVHAWADLGITYDGIYSGFVKKEQIDIVRCIVQQYGVPFYFDPVCADDGRLYDGFDSQFVQQLKSLIPLSDVLFPNITEAVLLIAQLESGGQANSAVGMADKKRGIPPTGSIQLDCGEVWTKIRSGCDKTVVDCVTRIVDSLHSLGAKGVVLTGIEQSDKISVAVSEGKQLSLIDSPRVVGSYSGAGDLLASIVVARMTKGIDITAATQHAVHQVYTAISNTKDNRYGIDFYGLISNSDK